MEKFEVGKTYCARRTSCSDRMLNIIITKRTKRTVHFKIRWRRNDTENVKEIETFAYIRRHGDTEIVYASYGNGFFDGDFVYANYEREKIVADMLQSLVGKYKVLTKENVLQCAKCWYEYQHERSVSND